MADVDVWFAAAVVLIGIVVVVAVSWPGAGTVPECLRFEPDIEDVPCMVE